MANWWDSAPVVGQTRGEQWWKSAPLASGAAQLGDVAMSFGSGAVRGVPQMIEGMGAILATPIQMGINAATGQKESLGDTFRSLAAQSPVTPAMNTALGPEYKPQTDAGRYAKSMGVGMSTGLFGGIPGAVSGLVGGAGSEAGGDAAAYGLGEDYRALGNITGGVLGGLSAYRYGAAPVARGMAKPSVDVPTADDIRTLANQKYTQAAEAGGVFAPSVSNKFLAEASKGFEAPSSLAAAAAQPAESMKYIKDFGVFADKPMTLADAQYLDEYLGDAIDSFVDATTGKVSKQGQKLLSVQNSLRDNIMNASEKEIVGGRAGVDALAEGRQLWQKQAKLRDIEKIITRAEMSQNPATALKTGFKTLYNNPSKLRGFSDSEKALIRNAAESGKVQDLLQTFGSRLLSPLVGSMVGGPIGALGGAIGATIPRSASTALQLGRANRVAEAVALGKPTGILQRASGMARNVAGEVGGQVRSDLGVLGKALGDQSGALRLPGQSLDDLPMDTASRMQRAREMGFDVDNPVYHGTGADVKAFKGSKANSSSGSGVPKGTTFFTDDPKNANTYARSRVGEKYTDIGGNVIKAAVRKGNNLNVQAEGKLTRDLFFNDITARMPDGSIFQGSVNELARKAKEAGYDTLSVGNVIDTGEGYYTPQTTTVVFDPKNIRSVNAKFDPAQANSSNLLAGVGALGLAGTGMYAGNANASTTSGLLKQNPRTPLRISVTPKGYDPKTGRIK